MATSSLTEKLRNSDRNKVRIGYRQNMDAYNDILKSMGNVYGEDGVVVDYEKVEVAEGQ